jgi:hypothetical protein
MPANKEHARKIGEAIMVCKYPDVCKSPNAPVPYMIVSNFMSSMNVATTVNATKDPTFTKASFIQGVIGDEGGTGLGVVSGTHAGGGASWAIDWAHTVRAEGQNVVRNGDPTAMNGHADKSSPNTQGTVVYPKAGAPNGGVGPDGKPTQNTNPGDPNWDKNSSAGIGAWDNKLRPDSSAALSPSLEKALNVNEGDILVDKTKDGTRIEMMELQRMIQKRTQMFETISNIINTDQETSRGIIQNMR